jgi:hypothetical protein
LHSCADAQGDIWDTQKDMALCLPGSILPLLFLTRLHDRSLGDFGFRITHSKLRPATRRNQQTIN